MSDVCWDEIISRMNRDRAGEEAAAACCFEHASKTRVELEDALEMTRAQLCNELGKSCPEASTSVKKPIEE